MGEWGPASLLAIFIGQAKRGSPSMPIVCKRSMKRDSFKGQALLVFAQGADDMYPFSFGSAKAARLLAAFAEHGTDKVLRELTKLAGDKLQPQYAAMLSSREGTHA